MKIRELLSGPEKWTKGWYASDADGESVPLDLAAPRVCLKGAAILCYYDLDEYTQVRGRICQAVGNIVSWNDAPERTYEDVKALVDELDI